MDRETIIECIVEIAERGEHKLFAVEQLDGELRGFGYAIGETRTIIDVSSRAGGQRDARRFAGALCDLLERRVVNEYLHDPDSLYAVCLMCEK